MASIEGTRSTYGGRLFDLPQPVAIGGLLLRCAVDTSNGTPTPYCINVEPTGVGYSGSSPDAVLSILPLPVRQMVRASLGDAQR